LQGYFSSRVRGFSPANSIQAIDHELIDLAHIIETRKSSIFEDIFELQMDTVADEEQAVLFDSLYIELEIIPSAIKADLVELANECPYEKGPAVLYARSVFPDSVFINSCEVMEEPVEMRLASLEVKRQEQSATVPGAIVYPNPAKDRFIVRLTDGETEGMIMLFDLSGRKVFEQKLQNGLTEISSSSFAGAIYLYSVYNKTGIVDRGKIVLQKE